MSSVKIIFTHRSVKHLKCRISNLIFQSPQEYIARLGAQGGGIVTQSWSAGCGPDRQSRPISGSSTTTARHYLMAGRWTASFGRLQKWATNKLSWYLLLSTFASDVFVYVFMQCIYILDCRLRTRLLQQNLRTNINKYVCLRTPYPKLNVKLWSSLLALAAPAALHCTALKCSMTLYFVFWN